MNMIISKEYFLQTTMKSFENEITIKKLALVKEAIATVKKEHARNEKIFNELCDSIGDTVVSGELLQNASLKLTIILERSDSLYEKLHELMLILEDLKSELLN